MSPIKVLLLLSFVLPLLSQQITLDFVVSDGDWYNASNWSPQVVPSPVNSTSIFIVTVPNGIRLTLPKSPFFHTLYCTGCQLTVGDAVIDGSIILDMFGVLRVDGSVTGSGQVTGGDITLRSEAAHLSIPLQDPSGITFAPLSFIDKVYSAVPVEITGFWNESYPSIGEFYLSADVGKDSSLQRYLTVMNFYWSGSTYYDNILVTGDSAFNTGPYVVVKQVDFGSNPNTTLLWVGGSLSFSGSGGSISLTSVACSGNDSCSFIPHDNNSMGAVTLTAGGFIDASNKGGPDADIVNIQGCSVTSEGRWASSVRLQESTFTVKHGSSFGVATTVYASMKTSVFIKDNVQVPNIRSDYLLSVTGDQQAVFQSLTATGVVEGRSILVENGVFAGQVQLKAFTYINGSLTLYDELYLTDSVFVLTNNARLNSGHFSLYLTNSKLWSNGTWEVTGDETSVYLDGNSTFINNQELIFSGGNFTVKSYKNETGTFYNFGVFHANHTGNTFYFEEIPFYQCSNGILRISSRAGALPRFFLSTQAIIWGNWDFMFDTKSDYDLIPDTGYPYAFTPTRYSSYGDSLPVWGSFHQNTYIGGVIQPLYGANCEDISTRNSVFSYYKLEDIPFYDVDKCAAFDPYDVPQTGYEGCGSYSSANRPLISFFLLLVLSLVLL